MSRSTLRRRKQMLAWMLALLMVLGVIPVDSFGGSMKVSAAEAVTYKLQPEESISGVDKKGTIAAGKYGTNDYFTLTGSAVRGNSSTYSFELTKQAQGAISFTVSGKATVKVSFSSNGSSNESQMVLLDGSGQGIQGDGQETVNNSVTGTSPVTITYTDLAAGTYQVVSPSDFSARGVRITEIEVEETPVQLQTTYKLQPEESISGVDKKGTIAAGKYGTNDYFTFTGSAVRGNSSTYSFELTKQAQGIISFTVSGKATVKVSFSSNGSSNESRMALLDGSGQGIQGDGQETVNNSVTGTSPVTITYTDLAAGTYQVVSPSDFSARGVRITEIEVEETTGSAASVSLAPVITGLPEGFSVAFMKDGVVKASSNASGSEVQLEEGTYNLAVCDASGAVAADYRASVSDATTIKIQSSMENPTISVSASTVSVAVKLASGSTLGASNAITAVNQADANDAVALVPGENATLKIDATYDLKVTDSDTKAIVGSKTSVKVTSDMATLEIALEATVVKPVIKINDKTGSSGYSLTLTNASNASDAHVYSAEEGFGKLAIGATYNLAMSGHADAAATATINGATGILVTAGLTAISVKVEVPVTEGLTEVDLTGGLLASESYADGQITVGEDMPYKATDASVQGSNNAKQLGNSGSNVNTTSPVPGSGAFVKIVPSQDGRFKVVVKAKENATFFTDTTNGETLADNTVFGTGGKDTKVFNVQKGHTYYLSAQGSKPTIYYMALDYRSQAAWSEISTPELLPPVMDVENGTITVPFIAEVGGIASDDLLVWMLDSRGEIAQTATTTETSDTGSVTFTPQASGDYTFKAFLQRTNELDKESNEVSQAGFRLPMAQPVLNVPENQGNGQVRVTWNSVPEAESYQLTLKDANNGIISTITTSNPTYTFSGLSVGANYVFEVKAYGNGFASENGVSDAFMVTAEGKKSWDFAAFGQGVTAMKKNGVAVDYATNNNAASGSVEAGAVSLKSMGSKGKLVPASTDGVAFYYTTIDPQNENFTLSADVTVNEWAYTNGQEGFGLMAADRVGRDGDNSVFWNNSYMASITKVEYYYDMTKRAVSDSGTKYSMKLGAGAQEKIGVTPSNIADETAVNVFSSKMYTLDTCLGEANMPAGTYNRVGAYTNTNDLGDYNAVTTFHLELQRNNTGYFLSYTENGKTTTQKFYHGDDGNELTKLDPNNIYIGFFASRSVDVTFSNIRLTTIAPADDAAAEDRPLSYVTPSYTVESSKIANSADYDFVYYGNADGTLNVKRGEEVIYNGAVRAGVKLHVPVTLNAGDNAFGITMTPAADYYPSKYERLSSYDAAVFTHVVNYTVSAKDIVYVAPSGRSGADGSYDSPMDIATALKYARAGQKIILKEGIYSLTSGLTVERGIDGTDEKLIYLMADPKTSSRPVLDFKNQGSGLVIAGDYWYLQGFDATNSTGKGVQISGSHNVADRLMTYYNGNTGLQISRYKGTDLWEDWPSDNLVLNCTSHNNADPGYEDADGFTAKLTVADGNVFDGCIAYYNADDGWDLYAKPETGAIGKVTIRNCIAYKNGYIQDKVTGAEINAGNGNGFKMGGSSITGYHLLENSVAFANKAKGIDSNSCPDIQVVNSTSFDNEGANVAFYTNDAKNTDFEATGIISMKTANTVGENIKPKGKQDTKKIYKDSNYYFNGTKSVNAIGEEASLSWFENTDTAAAIAGGITRNADGTINRNGYLVLTSAAPENAGAIESGQASGEIDLPAPVINSVGTGQSTYHAPVELSDASDAKFRILSSDDELRTAAGVSGSDYVLVETANLPGDDPGIALLNKASKVAGVAIGAYLKVNLYRMSASGQKLGEITDLKSSISFRLSVPAGLDGNLYDFGVIRIHNGEAQFLADMDSDPNTITIASDKFSAYAIVYTAKGGNTKVNKGILSSPKTDEEGAKEQTVAAGAGVSESNGAQEADAIAPGKQLASDTIAVLLATPEESHFPYGMVILVLMLIAGMVVGAFLYYKKKSKN